MLDGHAGDDEPGLAGHGDDGPGLAGHGGDGLGLAGTMVEMNPLAALW